MVTDRIKQQDDAMAKAAEAERQACAELIANIKIDEVLMAVGELGKSERRLVKALLPWLSRRIRDRHHR